MTVVIGDGEVCAICGERMEPGQRGVAVKRGIQIRGHTLCLLHLDVHRGTKVTGCRMCAKVPVDEELPFE